MVSVEAEAALWRAVTVQAANILRQVGHGDTASAFVKLFDQCGSAAADPETDLASGEWLPCMSPNSRSAYREASHPCFHSPAARGRQRASRRDLGEQAQRLQRSVDDTPSRSRAAALEMAPFFRDTVFPDCLAREVGADGASLRAWARDNAERGAGAAALAEAVAVHEVLHPLRHVMAATALALASPCGLQALGASASLAPAQARRVARRARGAALSCVRAILLGRFGEWRTRGGTFSMEYDCTDEAPAEEDEKWAAEAAARAIPRPGEVGGCAWRDSMTVKHDEKIPGSFTVEEEGPGLLWATKIGGPSHGFDVGPLCFLSVIANPATKHLIAHVPQWSCNGAATCYLRILRKDNPAGPWVLYLEYPEVDFPLRESQSKAEQAAFLDVVFSVFLSHALTRAGEMHLPLLTSHADFVRVMSPRSTPSRTDTVISIPPNPVLWESSDTLGPHDWLHSEGSEKTLSLFSLC